MTEDQQFFAPSNEDALDALLTQYGHALGRIEALYAAMDDAALSAAKYFLKGNESRWARGMPSPTELFADMEPAVKALDADYWNRAMELTDVMDFMPETRRGEWHNQIREMKCPPFTAETVRSTIISLQTQRLDFLAEKVDGLFRSLSGAHVTNRPEGFSKRMIIACVIGSFGMVDHTRAGHIHDLRSVVGKLTGRGDSPSWNGIHEIITSARSQTPEWLTFDAGSMRIRVYQNGNAHLEVHPQIAARLNQILAHLHPYAIPEKSRSVKQAPKPPKNFVLIEKPVPFAVINIISDMANNYQWSNGTKIFDKDEFGRVKNKRHADDAGMHMDRKCEDKHVWGRVKETLEAIGGTCSCDAVEFDYDARQAVSEIVRTGVIPDHKAHQFYPTPDVMARKAVDMARIEQGNYCLEPSAGTGAIAAHMPELATVVVEISALHCAVLESRLNMLVLNHDFLTWTTPQKFDRIVMNPPYSQGRVLLHIQHARGMLASGGRLVAIVPATMRGKELGIEGRITWFDFDEPKFPGTSIEVVGMIVDT